MKFKLTNSSSFKWEKPLLFIMKTFILLFCTTVFSFTTTNVFSQNTKVVISNDMYLTIDDVFNLIREQTDFSFLYERDILRIPLKFILRRGKLRPISY